MVADKSVFSIQKEFFKVYGNASAFSTYEYLDFYLDEDFEDNFKNITKNLSSESKLFYKWIFLRSLLTQLIYSDTLYLDDEIQKEEKFKEFYKHNVHGNKISEFNFTGEYNLHPFVDLNFSDDDLDFLESKDIIDAGAFTGDTALPLSKVTNKCVYAFEPFGDSFNLLKKNIENNGIKNIIPVNKTLGESSGKRTLYLSGDNFQGISGDESTLKEYDEKIVVDEISIDSFVESNNLDVGFIMIDVEGMEMDLLKGAINTIKSQKPILEISIYHKSTDFFDIIPWIADLNLGYSIEVIKEQPTSFLADTSIRCKIE